MLARLSVSRPLWVPLHIVGSHGLALGGRLTLVPLIRKKDSEPFVVCLCVLVAASILQGGVGTSVRQLGSG